MQNLTERGGHRLKAAFKGKLCEVRPGVDQANRCKKICAPVAGYVFAYVTCVEGRSIGRPALLYKSGTAEQLTSSLVAGTKRRSFFVGGCMMIFDEGE